MNLIWLKYVSYGCLAGAFFLYCVLRFKKLLAISGTTKLALYAACIVVACVAWHVQETNADQHSPRQLILGTVTWVKVSGHRSGAIDEDFQLKIAGGVLSPKFFIDFVSDNKAEQPIHVGDTLGVLYRTWDNVPLTVDELEGQYPGWHHRRYRGRDPFVWPVAIVGLVGFAGAFFASRNQEKPAPATILGDDGS